MNLSTFSRLHQLDYRSLYNRCLLTAQPVSYRLSRFLNPLPGLLVIGGKKCGTTSLFEQLAQHPQLLPAIQKEVHYFDGGRAPHYDSYAKGPEWYRSYFPPVRFPGITRRPAVAFEASPTYLFFPMVPERIHQSLPQVRMIVLLRDPTERAISHYFHSCRMNQETLPIMEALKAEESRMGPGLKMGDPESESHFRRHSYKSRGHYAEQIERYFSVFPREQFLFIKSEDYFAHSASVLKKVFQFVGVDPDVEITDLRPKGTGSKNRVDDEVYQYLDQYFEPHAVRLRSLLGEEFSWPSSRTV